MRGNIFLNHDSNDHHRQEILIEFGGWGTILRMQSKNDWHSKKVGCGHDFLQNRMGWWRGGEGHHLQNHIVGGPNCVTLMLPTLWQLLYITLLDFLFYSPTVHSFSWLFFSNSLQSIVITDLKKSFFPPVLKKRFWKFPSSKLFN